MENNLSSESASYEINTDLRNADIRKPSIAQVSILYSIAVLILLYIGFNLQKYALYPGLLITEFVLILIPPLILLFAFKYDIKKVLRLNRVSILNLVIVFFTMIFALPAVGMINMANLIIIKVLFGKVIIGELPASNGVAGLIINILVVAGSAGICEEVMFRGVIQRGFERIGAYKAIIITAFLFGMIHLDFQRLLGTFLLGAIIGFVVYRTNSLFSGMFAHFTNNSIAVIIPYVITKVFHISDSSGLGGLNTQNDINKYLETLINGPKVEFIAAIAVWSFIFLVFAVAVAGLITALIYSTSDKVEKVKKDRLVIKTGILLLIPGLVIIALRYFAEGLAIKGVTSGIADFIIRLAGFR